MWEEHFMSNEQVIEKLIDQINSNMQIFLGILALLLAIFGLFQWRFSNSQIAKLRAEIKNETRKEIAKEYGLDDLDKLKRKVEGIVKEEAEQLYNRIEDAFASLDMALINSGKYSNSAEDSSTVIYNNTLYILSSKIIAKEDKQTYIKKINEKIDILKFEIDRFSSDPDKAKWEQLEGQISSNLKLLITNTSNN